LGTNLIHFIPRDNVVQRAEIHKHTVLEYNPNIPQAQEYRQLANNIVTSQSYVILKPITQDRLEEILTDFGLMDTLSDDYRI